MKLSAPVRHRVALLGLAVLASLPAAAGPQTGLPLPGKGHVPLPAAAHNRLQAAYGKLPLAFERNMGQADRHVQFLARGSGYSLFLTPNQAVFALSKHTPSPRFAASTGKISDTPQAVLHMRLLGSNAQAVAVGQQELAGKANYLLGNQASHWQTNVPLYQKVSLHNLYPGIDLIYYGNQTRLEYDFVLAPKASASAIRLGFSGAGSVQISQKGELLVGLPGGQVVWQRPVAYQQVGAKRIAVAGRYALLGKDQVGFQLGRYDTSKPLVIDPTLLYSTYLGGSSDDYGYSVTLDPAGNTYVVGYTTSTNFPVTSGAFQTSTTGFAAFVAKINSTGSKLVYATYLGGTTSSNTQGYGIAVDLAGNAYVTGATNAKTFPVVNGFQTSLASTPGDDAFLSKLNPSGSALLYSTYVGGNSNDTAFGIAVDYFGNAYITGETASTNFPLANAYQTSYGGGTEFGDAFLTRVDTTKTGAASLIYSTYLGGSADDYGESVATDNAGNAYVAGYTASTNFPVSSSPYQKSQAGSANAFITKINTNASSAASLLYSTYLGGSAADYAYGIAIDPAGNAYVTGPSTSANFPTTSGAFQTTSTGTDAFVTKLNPSGSALVYSTFLGGSAGTLGTDIAVDGWGHAFVTGNTAASNFPTTTNGVQRTFGGVFDAFVTEFNTAGSALLYSTYLGGSNDDEGFGIEVSPSGSDVAVTGFTSSTNFPTLNPIQSSNAGGSSGTNDAFVAKLRLFTRGDFNADNQPDVLFQNPTTGQMAAWFMSGTKAVNGAYIAPFIDPNLKLAAVADLNGDGQPDLLFENANTGQVVIWIMNQAAASGVVVLSQNQNPANVPVGVADMNGDGKPDLIFQNTSTGQVTFWYMNGTTVTGTASVTPNAGTSWKVIGTGDFNNDGKPDLLYANLSTGQMQIGYLTGTTVTSTAYVSQTQNTAWQPAAIADFNKDGHPDILFYNPSTGQMALWYLGGSLGNTVINGQYVTLTQAVGWKPIGAADLNGDGIPDIVFQDQSSDSSAGRVAVWFMSSSLGNIPSGGAYILPTMDPNQVAVGEGDFNGDGQTDILLQNKTTGALTVWLMNGAQASQAVSISATVPSGFQAVAVADVDLDGTPDIIFENPSNGQVIIWLMNGTTMTKQIGVAATVPANWSIVGTGDFNGDGLPDIVLQNASTAQLAVWFMQGNVVTGASYITPTQSAGWKAVAFADYNGDGQTDIMFMNPSTGQLAVWFMNGTTATGGAFVTPTQDTHWIAVGPR